jgi:hypothetical protein
MRRWESKGILPKPRYWQPSDHPAGRRRLYTRRQIREIELAAIREGITSHRRLMAPVSPRFTQEVRAALAGPLVTTQGSGPAHQPDGGVSRRQIPV